MLGSPLPRKSPLTPRPKSSRSPCRSLRRPPLLQLPERTVVQLAELAAQAVTEPLLQKGRRALKIRANRRQVRPKRSSQLPRKSSGPRLLSANLKTPKSQVQLHQNWRLPALSQLLHREKVRSLRRPCQAPNNLRTLGEALRHHQESPCLQRQGPSSDERGLRRE